MCIRDSSASPPHTLTDVRDKYLIEEDAGDYGIPFQCMSAKYSFQGGRRNSVAESVRSSLSLKQASCSWHLVLRRTRNPILSCPGALGRTQHNSVCCVTLPPSHCTLFTIRTMIVTNHTQLSNYQHSLFTNKSVKSRRIPSLRNLWSSE